MYIPDFPEMLAVSHSHGAGSEAPDLWEDLNALWPFGAGGGPTAYDLSGYGNQGTLTSMDPATDWVPSPYGWALDFDGTSQYVTFGTQLNNTLNDSFSILMWVATDADGVTLFGNRGAANSRLMTRGIWGANALRVTEENVGVITGGGTFQSGWNHCVWTYDKTNTQHSVYLNNVLVASKSQAFGGAYAGNSYLSDDSANQLDGRIANCLIYNRSVSLSEIQQLYEKPNDMLTLRQRVYSTAVAPGGLSIPIAMRHYLQIQGAG